MISFDFFRRRRPQVILWGASNYIASYLPCLKEAGMQVAFAVDPCNQGMPTWTLPVKTLPQFRSRIQQLVDTPIIALENRSGNYTADPWAAAFDEINRQSETPCRVVDPVFICDRLKYNFRGRAVAAGFPGSGNAVTQTIIDRLMALKPLSWTGKEHLLGFLTGQRLERLQRALRGTLEHAGVRVDYASVTVASSDQVMLQAGTKENEQVILFDVPSRPHMHSDQHRTHQVIDAKNIEYYHNLGFEIFVTIRHPLDILLSAASKMAADPQPVLADLAWFRDLAAALTRYSRAFADDRGRVHCVRYEDLLAQPVETIRRIAACLNIDCSPEQAQAIWEAVGFKPLNRNPQHLWKPGAGKWRRYLSTEHLAIAREQGIFDVVSAQGYELDVKLEEPLSREDRVERGQDQKSTTCTDGLYSVLYDMPRHVFHPDVVMDTSPTLQSRYLCTSAATRDAVRIFEESAATRSLLDSLPRWSASASTTNKVSK